jgi:hypothetical protein
VVCKLLKNGGSVCESNAPATSEMPPAGFEDHQVTFDSPLIGTHVAVEARQRRLPKSND